DGQGLHRRRLGQLGAQRLGQVGHLAEVARAALVDPAEQLRGAEALLAQALAERSQPLEVEVEQVDGGVHACARAVADGAYFSSGKKKAISTLAVSGASEPCTALASMLSAKSARMVPGAAF